MVKRTVMIGSAKAQRKLRQKRTTSKRTGIRAPPFKVGKIANATAGKQNIPPINTTAKIAAVL
jgi:hypothetical protein